MKQYHSFSTKGIDFRKKIDKKDTANTPEYWWTAAAYSSYYAYCCVSPLGAATIRDANRWDCGVPLCFRFVKENPDDPFNGVVETGTENVCLLRDDNGVVTSDYGFTYNNLSEILNSGEYEGYIKDGDWIELSTPDGGTYKMYANVDTYYGEGEEGKEIGHHIDFISEELIYGSTSRENGTNIYRSTDINSWRMNYNTSYDANGSNNGVADETSPFLANTTEYRGKQGGIIDKLDAYYVANINDGLKAHIVKKYHKVPTRYSGNMKNDDGTKWAEMPYLWIPYEKEVWGDNTNNSTTGAYESHMKQYQTFSSKGIDFRLKIDKKDTANSPWYWWTASAGSGNNTYYRGIHANGNAHEFYAYYWSCGAPLCFRF